MKALSVQDTVLDRLGIYGNISVIKNIVKKTRVAGFESLHSRLEDLENTNIASLKDVKTINQFIKKQFNIKGTDLKKKHVKFLEQGKFAKRFPSSEIKTKLLEIFVGFRFDPFISDILKSHELEIRSRRETLIQIY